MKPIVSNSSLGVDLYKSLMCDILFPILLCPSEEFPTLFSALSYTEKIKEPGVEIRLGSGIFLLNDEISEERKPSGYGFQLKR